MKVSSSVIIEKYIDEDRLGRFLDEVEKANRRFNLYSRRLSRHDLRIFVAESLLPVELGWIAGNAKRLIDIGSGWGIPAVPLLLAEIPVDITMVERSQKKADFVYLLLRRLDLKADIVCGDIAGISSDKPYDSVTARGVSVDNALYNNLKKISKRKARFICFGPDFPGNIFESPQYIDYAIDKLPGRRMWTAEIL